MDNFIQDMIITLAKALSYDEIVALLIEHIKLYSSGSPKGKPFLERTCSLLIAKSLIDAGVEIKDDSEKSLNDALNELKNFIEDGKN